MKKQRVIVVTPGGSFFRDPHVRAFERFGYECLTYNSRHGFVYCPWFRRISRRIPFLDHLKKRHVRAINQGLLSMVRTQKPRYLFAQKAETIFPETIDAIKRSDVVTINFFNDFEWPVASKIAPHYDYFFTQHVGLLEKLRTELALKNCFHLHHAAEPLLDPFIRRVDKYPVSFIGTYNSETYPNRENYLKAVEDLGLNIWGNEAWRNTSVGNCFHGRAHGDDRFDIYGSSKIVIDINWEHIASDGISVRPFEVAASGACLFADTVKKDIFDVYEQNKEFIPFSGPEDLRSKVLYYLGHDEERKAIAQAGYERTVKEHTYDHRLRQMLDTIDHPGNYLYK